MRLPRLASPLLSLVLPCFGASQASAQVCAPGWNPLGQGINGPVYSLNEWDPDGIGPSPKLLIAGGLFTGAGTANANSIAAWNGSAWTPLATGMSGPIYALATFDEDGSGPNAPRLFAGGSFTSAGSLNATNIARWDGTSWTPVIIGSSDGPNCSPFYTTAVYALQSISYFTAMPQLAVGGAFCRVAGTPAQAFALWDGTQWRVTASSTPTYVYAICEYSTFPSARLGYFAGDSGSTFSHVYRFYGAPTQQVDVVASIQSGSTGGTAFAMEVFDEDGSGPLYEEVIIGGVFPHYIAAIDRVDNLLKFNGNRLAPLSYNASPNAAVYALASFDPDGAGGEREVLVSGGVFTAIGTQSMNRIAAWNGSAWSMLGSGMNQPVFALHSFDPDDAGTELPMLIAGGEFSDAGGMPAARIAAWAGCPSPPTLPCPGDISGNGSVGLDDVSEVIINWGSECE